MKITRFQHISFPFFQAFAYLLALGILIFTGIMLTKIVPYMNFEHATNFLGTKTDAVLYKTHFRIAFYIHITSSVFVMGAGIFQFFPSILFRFPRFHRTIGKIYIGSILLLAAPSGLVLATYANGGLAAKVLKDFSVGERDVEINESYRKLGWDNLWENDEWWTKASSDPVK